MKEWIDTAIGIVTLAFGLAIIVTIAEDILNLIKESIKTKSIPKEERTTAALTLLGIAAICYGAYASRNIYIILLNGKV